MSVALATIRRATCDVYSLTESALLSDRRARSVSHPRQIAMYLARELTTHSLPSIGRHMGGRDHSTVLHACRQVEQRLHVPDTARVVSAIRIRALALSDMDAGDGVSGD